MIPGPHTQPRFQAAQRRLFAWRLLARAFSPLLRDISGRIFDCTLALLLAPLVLALCLAIAVLVLLADGRPVFHPSPRMKSPTRSFILWKFRTMRPDVEGGDDGGVTGGHKSSRITRFGALLRSSRLDELPQLWNILCGDMGFVGPRPPLPSVVRSHPAIYQHVLRIRPGVTGLASLAYHRHESMIMRECQSPADAELVYARRCIPAKARLDAIYLRHRSLFLDLNILVSTLLPHGRGRARILSLIRARPINSRSRLTKPKEFIADDQVI